MVHYGFKWPVSFLEHVIYWRTYFVSARAILTANVLCKITFALNSAVTCNGPTGWPKGLTVELTHNNNNIIVTCCTVPK